MAENKPGNTSAEDIKANPEGCVELSENQLEEAAGGRVKTSDKIQKAVMDFVKG